MSQEFTDEESSGVANALENVAAKYKINMLNKKK